MERDQPSTPGAGLPAPVTETVDGELRLLVDGAVQSVGVRDGETPRGYWRALLAARAAHSALILGLGAGTVAHLLHRQSQDARITGIDDDPQVLALAHQHFGIDGLGLNLVCADAHDFVRTCRERYELVIVDLFRGEHLTPLATQRSFIRRLRTLVRPGGMLVWNLHRDRRSADARRRVGEGLLLERRILAGLNLVLHFRRRRYRRIAQ